MGHISTSDSQRDAFGKLMVVILSDFKINAVHGEFVPDCVNVAAVCLFTLLQTG